MRDVKGAIAASYRGESDTDRGSRVMTMIGVGGMVSLEHVSLEMETEGLVLSISSYEVGDYESVQYSKKDNHIRASTSGGSYVLSPDLPLGSRIGLDQIRAAGQGWDDCALLYKKGISNYRVFQNGTISCYDSKGKHWVAYVAVGQDYNIMRGVSCSNRCFLVGPKYSKAEARRLLASPAAHPALAPPGWRELQGSPYHGDMKKEEQERSNLHDQIMTDIRESQAMIESIRQDRDRTENGQDDTMWQLHMGWGAGLVGSLLVAAALFVSYRCWRRRRPPPTTAVVFNTGGAATPPSPILGFAANSSGELKVNF